MPPFQFQALRRSTSENSSLSWGHAEPAKRVFSRETVDTPLAIFSPESHW